MVMALNSGNLIEVFLLLSYFLLLNLVVSSPFLSDTVCISYPVCLIVKVVINYDLLLL